MENNDNPNLKAFTQDFKRMMGKLEIESSELIYLTDDNSFPDFLMKFCNDVGADIEKAIKEEKQEPKEKGIIENYFNRYLYSVTNNLSIKLVRDNLQLVLIDINVLFLNWLRMIDESKLHSLFCISNEAVKTISNMISNTDNILKGTLNLEKLIWMTGNLITKAKEVISATPPSFNISDHYARAIKKSIED